MSITSSTTCRAPGLPFRDFRVFVVAGKAVAMMSRRGEDWITNVNRGAVPEQISGRDEGELARLAVAAADAVGADFAGVDIVPAADGSLLVLEVNSMPAWSGLQSVVAVDIADAIAEALLKVVADRARGGAALPLRLAGEFMRLFAGPVAGRLRRRVPARDRGAEARQRARLRRRAPHVRRRSS